MTVPATDELLIAVAELCAIFPGWRFGQLVLDLASAAAVTEPDAVWDTEDDQLLAAARRLIERNLSRIEPQPTT